MALITCPDCGAGVSDSAPACPRCGRPMGAPTPARSDARVLKKGGRRTPITITISSFAIIAIGLVLAVLFVPALQIGQHLEARCQVNGLGSGSCQFTNTGWTPGSQCVVVRLVNKNGGMASSGPLCSGRVWPNDTKQQDVSIVVGDTCSSKDMSWSDFCAMEVRDFGDAPSSAGTPSSDSAPSSLPATARAGGAPTPSETTSQGATVPDPFDANAALRVLPQVSDGDGKPVQPKLVYASAPYTSGGSATRLLLVSYANQGDCHACGVSVAGGVFTRGTDGWALATWNPSITTFGSFGQLGGDAKPFPLSGHEAIILAGGYTGMGEVDSYADLIAVVNGQPAVVWDGSTGSDTTGTGTCNPAHCTKWTGQLKVASASVQGWPDLELQSSGIAARDDNSIESMNRTKTFTFDGTKYGQSKDVVDAPAALSAAPASSAAGVSSASSVAPPGP